MKEMYSVKGNSILPTMNYVVWVWRNTVGVRQSTAISIVAGICQISLGLLQVLLCKLFIDTTIRTGEMKDVARMIVLLVLTALGGILLRQLYYYLTTTANARQTNVIRLRIFGHLLRRQMYGEQTLHSGDITSRLERDIDSVGSVTTTILPQFIVSGIQLLGAFLLMNSMDSRLAWMLLLLTPLVVAFTKILSRRLRQMTLDIREQESRVQMLVQEGMEHNDVLRTLGSGMWVIDQLEDLQEDLQVKIKRRTRFTVFTRLMLSCSFTFGYLLAFVWGGLQLHAGLITFGVMTSFLQLVAQIQHPILTLLNLIPQAIHSTASIDRLKELEDLDAETEGRQIVLNGRLGVSLQEVSFGYPMGERQILDHFSHDFLPGSKTAIVGLTGAGKTTIFRLMLALIQPSDGRITIYSDHQREDLSSDTRSNFVFVPQGNTLMSGTVRYNLLLAKPDATDEELWHVLHTAMADFVETLPGGLDCKLGERGVGISEGQAQRIAIARGLLRPGNIMLLDEISSSLDEQTERELFSRLFTRYAQKTIIMITHRSAVAALCDHTVQVGA